MDTHTTTHQGFLKIFNLKGVSQKICLDKQVVQNLKSVQYKITQG